MDSSLRDFKSRRLRVQMSLEEPPVIKLKAPRTEHYWKTFFFNEDDKIGYLHSKEFDSTDIRQCVSKFPTGPRLFYREEGKIIFPCSRFGEKREHCISEDFNSRWYSVSGHHNRPRARPMQTGALSFDKSIWSHSECERYTANLPYCIGYPRHTDSHWVFGIDSYPAGNLLFQMYDWESNRECTVHIRRGTLECTRLDTDQIADAHLLADFTSPAEHYCLHSALNGRAETAPTVLQRLVEVLSG